MRVKGPDNGNTSGMTSRPAAVAFDVIETLLSLEPLRDRLAAVGQPPFLLDTWYTRTLRDGIALSVTGEYAEFPDVAAAALRTVTRNALTDAEITHVLAGFADLPAHPDALPAVRTLATAGVRVACLTNGNAKATTSFAERAGLLPFIERVITVGEVARWKPNAIIYRYAAERLDVPPERLALVAVHAWDCHGAKRAGLMTGWASRREGRYPSIFAAPDVTGADLTEVAKGILALPVEP
jgi:2-haloacid dehalogenase